MLTYWILFWGFFFYIWNFKDALKEYYSLVLKTNQWMKKRREKMLMSGTHVLQTALYVQRWDILESMKEESRIYESTSLASRVWWIWNQGQNLFLFFWVSVTEEKPNIGNFKLLSVFLFPSLPFVSYGWFIWNEYTSLKILCRALQVLTPFVQPESRYW